MGIFQQKLYFKYTKCLHKIKNLSKQKEQTNKKQNQKTKVEKTQKTIFHVSYVLKYFT